MPTLLNEEHFPRLLSSCREHLLFLRAMHRTGVTVHLSRSSTGNDSADQPERGNAIFAQAMRRYRDIWLPLVANYPKVPLVPPSDIAFLWHCHRLCPLVYVKYCQKHFDGNILEAVAPFTFQHPNDPVDNDEECIENRREAWVTRLVWRQLFPSEDFFLAEAKATTMPDSSSSSPTAAPCYLIDEYNLRGSAQAQAEFLWHISSGPQWEQDEFLQQAIQRYKNFLSIAQHVSDPKQKIVPCYDIDLAWHTHILQSQNDYQQTCLELCGKPFHHDDAFNDRKGSGTYGYQQAWKFTCAMYQQVYKEPFDGVPGTLYYGPPAPAYWEYQTWDPIAPWHHNNNRRRRWWRRWWWSPGSNSDIATDGTYNNSKQKGTIISWRDLLDARGRNLWTIRRKVFLPHNASGHVQIPSHQNSRATNPNKGFLSRVKSKSSISPSTVLMVGSPSHFQMLEATQGMDKRGVQGNFPAALTQSTGDEWKRQRKCMAQQALATVKQMSLQAVDQVQWESLWQRQATECVLTSPISGENNTVVVDLKDMVAQAVLTWSSGLFGGIVTKAGNIERDDDHLLRDNLKRDFWNFWQASRALRKNKTELQSTRQQLVASVRAVAEDTHKDHQSGLIHLVFQQDFTVEVASINCVHAMVAASDTTMVLVFWTLYHLGRSERAWRTCQHITWSEEAVANDLEQLANLKANATSGSAIDPSELSFLGRALIESARVYPPVWSLPRVLPDGTSVQFDVAWANGAVQDPEWNSYRRDGESIFLATFGVGQRHCPGGTAALWAAHALLRRFVSLYEPIVECQPRKALDSLYLGPTLCLEGLPFFELSRRQLEE